jgi:hypothetical protein
VKFVLCLCDITGHFSQYWEEFGYTSILVDPQHADVGEGQTIKLGLTVREALPFLGPLCRSGQVAFVAGFPPCTDVAVSGARWWAEKAKIDPYFQAKAAIVAEQCRMLGELSGAPWFFENPVSAFSGIFGSPGYIFDPCDYAGYAEEDNYFKKTCLWTGGNFKMPHSRPRGQLGRPDNRIFEAPPGPDRANFRSATPRGFAIACLLANCPEVAL